MNRPACVRWPTMPVRKTMAAGRTTSRSSSITSTGTRSRGATGPSTGNDPHQPSLDGSAGVDTRSRVALKEPFHAAVHLHHEGSPQDHRPGKGDPEGHLALVLR